MVCGSHRSLNAGSSATAVDPWACQISFPIEHAPLFVFVAGRNCLGPAPSNVPGGVGAGTWLYGPHILEGTHAVNRFSPGCQSIRVCVKLVPEIHWNFCGSGTPFHQGHQPYVHNCSVHTRPWVLCAAFVAVSASLRARHVSRSSPLHSTTEWTVADTHGALHVKTIRSGSHDHRPQPRAAHGCRGVVYCDPQWQG